jgi:predicted Holliday junction resolvase-like endonuclease
MDVTQLSFGTKDVIAIVLGLVSILGFLYALRESTTRVTIKCDNLNSEITNLKVEYAQIITEMKTTIANQITHLHDKVKEKEQDLSKKIEYVREEAKESNEKLSAQLLGFGVQLTQISSSLSELTGYIKAKTEK